MLGSSSSLPASLQDVRASFTASAPSGSHITVFLQRHLRLTFQFGVSKQGIDHLKPYYVQQVQSSVESY